MEIKFILLYIFLFTYVLSFNEDYQYYSNSVLINRGFFALTEIPILCPPQSALLKFKLLYDNIDNKKIKFGFNCYNSLNIDYKGEYVDYTNWTESDPNMDFLNKHHIKCKSNYVLRGFTMEFNKFDNIDKVRFRYNCYPIDNSIQSQCLNDSLFSTGWKKNNNSSIESLIEQKIDSHCENCVINSFKIDMKYSENIQIYLNQEWVNNFNFGWCIIRESLQ